MLFNIHCPNCGAEQRGLNLEETEGYFFCSVCERKIIVDIEEAKKETLATVDKKLKI